MASSQVIGRKAQVTWTRDVPQTVHPQASLPSPPRSGLSPLGIVGIVIGGLVVLSWLASLGNTANPDATATAKPNATVATTPSAITSAGQTTSTLTPTTVAGVDATSTARFYASATAVAGSRATPTTVPMVVTVKDASANVRQAPAQDAPVVTTVDVGLDLFVLGPDTTGPDGATRWVHVEANDTNGFVRSDLVTMPHVVTPVPPTPTPAPDLYADYPVIDAADWAKRPDFYKGRRFSVVGEAFNVRETGGVTTFQMWVETSLGKTVSVGVAFQGTSSLVDGMKLRAYGVGRGSFTGTNGFGASITQPLMDAAQIGPPTTAMNGSTAAAYAANTNATGTAIIRYLDAVHATGTVLTRQTDRSIATSDAVIATTDAVIQALKATQTARAKP